MPCCNQTASRGSQYTNSFALTPLLLTAAASQTPAALRSTAASTWHSASRAAQAASTCRTCSRLA